ncbi:SdrD B-like domain-containing protein [Cohnella sp. GCM10027633]|uniref:SdrD B-like domain-containing protein n=1 Tax=unclassified Cohnella TaxID=2636738 RepID=UPI0036314421
MLDSNVGGTSGVPEIGASVITDTFVLGATDDVSIDAGLYPPLGAIGNYVWADTDGDGIQDGGEPGIAGVEVHLLDQSGNPVLDALSNPMIETTDGTGFYEFTDLLPGNYRVQFPEKVGTAGNEKIITFKSHTSSTPLNDSNPNANGRTDVIALQLGEINHTIDAGYVEPVELGDLVWYDGDYDGVQGGASDTPASGITVRLLDGSNNPVKAADGTTNRTFTTAADGEYLFDYLLPGTYKVEFQLPAGYGFTRKDRGGNDTLDSDVNRTANLSPTVQTSGRTDNYVLTTPGTSNLTADAGLVQLSSLGDLVWVDRDADGVQDGGESGVSGVTVRLYYAEDASPATVYRTATTSGTGAYAFNNLYPGHYTVEVVRPANYLFSPKAQGGDTATDSNVNVPGSASTTNAQTDQITLPPGTNDTTIDAGLIPLAAVGDFVWRDVNDDGLQSGGLETGVSGITVTLLDDNGDPVSQNAYGQAIAPITTPANGSYRFEYLLPGDYTVKFELPTGTKDWFTTANANANANDTTDSDAIEQTDKKIALADVTLAYGDNNTTIDAGIHKLAALGDRVWLDADGDGVQDAGESGYDGIEVALYNAAGTTQILLDAYGNDISNVTTAGGGLYKFENLLPGTYRVKFSGLPAFYEFTLRASGAAGTDSDADPNDLVPATFGMTQAVTLAWGEENLTLDAGIVTRTQIGDFVWLDLDGDGVQDATEPGIEGVTVHLLNGNGDPIIGVGGVPYTRTTDADGEYLFTNLWPGDFKVKFDLPSDYYIFSPSFSASGTTATDSDADTTTGVSGTITLSSGDDIRTIDAGLVELVSVGDLLWDDLDGDGVRDAGEPGYAGVTVSLLDNAGNPVLSGGSPITDTTDASGNYLFEKLIPGTYRVKFDLPTGYMFSALHAASATAATDSDADPSTGITAAVSLPPATHDMTVDAGIVKLATLGDTVWMDRDLDGIQDSDESGVPGVTVWLLDTVGTILRTTTTDASGKYEFANVVPATYQVQFDAVAGYVRTQQGAGADTGADSNADVASGRTANVTLIPGEVNRTIDAGLVKLVKLGDTLWLDNGSIGAQEGEAAAAAVSGVTVRLLDTNGDPILSGGTPVTTVTDANGNYSFDDLYPGFYKVKFDLPAGHMFTVGLKTGAGMTTANDSNVGADGLSDAIELIAGNDDLTVDAGIVVPASLGDYVWFDQNGDGIQDATEEAIEDIEVKLLAADGTVLRTTTTAADGSYGFANLMPATYRVKFTVKPGYMFSLKGAGTASTGSDADMDGETDPVTLTPGEHNADIDAGMLPLPMIMFGKLGDYVWIDANGDGLQDADEKGLNGVTVELYNSLGARAATTTTKYDSDNKAGYYVFDPILPGSYTVKFHVPQGYVLSPKKAGQGATRDSDAGADGKSDVVALMGGEDMTIDAGLVPLGSIGDYVWIDADRDGKQSASEIGMNGVEVKLYDKNGTELAATTTANVSLTGPGYYAFKNLTHGEYEVRFSLPEGYAFTKRGSSAAAGNDSNAAANGATARIALLPGEHNRTIDAGLYALEEEKPADPEPNEEGSNGEGGGDSGLGNSGTNDGGEESSSEGGRGDNKSGLGLGRDNGVMPGKLPKTGEPAPLTLYLGYALIIAAIAGLAIRRIAIKRSNNR